MSEERLAVEIRDAFDPGYEPNRGLEDRVLAAIPWETPRRRPISWPRLAGGFVAALAVITIVTLIAPTILTRLNSPFPGSGPGAGSPAYSLASVTANSLFVIQRGGPPSNTLLQSIDGGRTWTDRLHFTGVYDGMQMYEQDGFVWSIDMEFVTCGAANQPACQAPTKNLRLFRTRDGGATWTALPSPDFAANGVFFLDARHGWIDSGSPMTGLGNDTLYATTDGGQTWSLAGALPQSAPMGWVYGVGNYHVTFSSPLRGWYLGNNELFTTADGGHSWRLVEMPPPNIPVVNQVTATPSQPVISGADGILPVAWRISGGPDNATPNQLFFYVTQDGGATWGDPRFAPTGFAPVGDILAITVLDSQHVWLTSQSESGGDNVQAAPAVARSVNGALTWVVYRNHVPRILQMTFSDAVHGFALDVTGQYNVNGILSTSDGGATWQRVNVPVFG